MAMVRDLLTLQRVFDEIIKKNNYYGGFLVSQEGLIILDSGRIDSETATSLAAKVVSSYSGDGIGFDELERDLLSFPNRLIFSMKVDLFDAANTSLIVIVVMPPDTRYYVRKVNKIVKLLPKFLNAQELESE